MVCQKCRQKLRMGANKTSTRRWKHRKWIKIMIHKRCPIHIRKVF